MNTTLGRQLARLEQRYPPEPAAHRHLIGKVIILERPKPDEAALRAWEAAQPPCTCNWPSIVRTVLGRGGVVGDLAELLL